jgi:hypothetical protein
MPEAEPGLSSFVLLTAHTRKSLVVWVRNALVWIHSDILMITLFIIDPIPWTKPSSTQLTQEEINPAPMESNNVDPMQMQEDLLQLM